MAVANGFEGVLDAELSAGGPPWETAGNDITQGRGELRNARSIVVAEGGNCSGVADVVKN